MIRRLISFWRLESERRRLLLRAARELGFWSLQLRKKPFADAIRLAQSKASRNTLAIPAHTPPEALHIAWAVRTAARHLPLKPACLPQSLALVQMLNAHGIHADLHISVSADNHAAIDRSNLMPPEMAAGMAPGFAAHAWVSVAGEPLAEPAADPSWRQINSFSF